MTKAKRKYLTAAEILGANDIEREDVPVEEWGGTVCVQAMTGTMRDIIEAKFFGPATKDMSPEERFAELRATTVALSVVDDKGELCFTLDHVKALGKKSATGLDKVFQVSQRLSGISKEAADGAAKNSENAQTAGSTSD